MAKQCKRCGLSEYWTITIFDAEGVCNFCRYYESVGGKLRNFGYWQKIFSDHIETHKGKYEYDAVVAFSGGKDSSYIAYMLKEVYHCRVLAVTVDFGFMPTPIARDNIKRVVSTLQIDHLFYTVPDSHVKVSFGNAVRQGKLCELCTTFTGIIPRKVAIEKQIPFYILGSDRGQMFRELSPETREGSGAPMIYSLLQPYSAEKTRSSESLESTQGIRAYLQGFGFPESLCKEMVPDPEPLSGTSYYPSLLQFFLFHPHKEKQIKQLLVEKANWQIPQNDHLLAHHDCALHNSVGYFLRQSVGKTLTTGEIAVDVREGEIDREESLQVLALENEKLASLEDPYKVFNDLFGVQEKELTQAGKRLRRKMNAYRNLRKVQFRFSRPKLKRLTSYLNEIS